MDRNSIIGILLIIGIMLGYTFLTRPSEEELAEQRRLQDSIVRVEAIKSQAAQATQPVIQPAATDSLVIADSVIVAQVENDSTVNADSLNQVKLQQQFGGFARAVEGEEKHITIENELLEVKISTKGGQLVSARLKNYRTYDSLALYLFREKYSKFNLTLFLPDGKPVNTADMYFEPMGGDINVSGKDSGMLVMRLNAGDNRSLDLVYGIRGDNYMMNFDVRFNNLAPALAANTTDLPLNWTIQMPRQEKSLEREQATSTIYFKYEDEEPDYLTETSDETQALDMRTDWIAFKQQFFSTILIADDHFSKVNSNIETRTITDNPRLVKEVTAQVSIPFDPASSIFGMALYLGPNHHTTMKKYDQDFEKIIPLGWGIFGWVNRFLVIPVFNLLNGINMNFGIIILILTLLIKVILFPLTYKAYLSSAKMRVLKPEIDEIGKKYGKDKPLEKQQEVMALYKKAGVSPFGGCLPLLLQMPILIAMFNFFPSSIELRQEAFLWAEDLSTYDSILDLGFTIPFYGDHVSLFTLLMTVSTILYTRMNSQMTMSSEMKSMQWMMYLMPVLFLGVFNNYSAGLSYYYFLANMITFGQQFLMRRFVDDDALRAKIEENRKKPVSHKKSSFQKRLEEAAKKRGYKPR